MANHRMIIHKRCAYVAVACLLAGCGLIGVTPQPSISQGDVVESASGARFAFRIVPLFDLGRRDVRNFAFCPVTRQLYVSHLDRRDDLLYQWDLDSGQLVHLYRLGGEYFCDEIVVSPDGRYLLVGCYPFHGGGGKILLINLTEKRVVHDFGRNERIIEARFSADSQAVWMRAGLARVDGVAFRIDGSQIDDFSRDDFPRRGPADVWTVPGSIDSSVQHGLFYRDSSGHAHLLTDNHWHDNYGITSDGIFIAATNWEGEIVVWDAETRSELFRAKTRSGDNGGGYLAYDALHNQFLIGDCSYDGTTWLRALVIEELDTRERGGG